MSAFAWGDRMHPSGKPKLLRLATVAAVVLGSLTTGSAQAAESCSSSVPFTSGADGYHTFRIPAVVRAANGDLLAFAEGRHESAGDTGAIDVVLRSSTDAGCTWGPLSVITTNGDGTAGNPSPAVLPTGRLVLLTTHNGANATESAIMTGQVSEEDSRRVFVQHSDDNGRNWTQPAEITADTKLPDWRWYATGPGHAIVLRHGPHAGRIVIPANHSTAPPPGSIDTGAEKKYYGGHDLYSDDGGRTWRIGFVDDNADGQVNANETTVAELPDGTLYFNSRDAGGTAPGNRVDARSRDAGGSLVEPYQAQPGLVGPQVQASVLQTTNGNLLLFSGPSRPDSRAAMRLRTSTDGGRTWRDGHLVSDRPAAYSDLVQLDPTTVGLLYETGVAGPYETIAFQRIPLRQVTS
jgi:sialidase-1